MFEPMIFHNAISVCFFVAAITEVASSGIDVQTATILAQISTVETLNMVARRTALVTSASHQIYNHHTHSAIYATATCIEYFGGSMSSSTSCFFTIFRS